MFDLTVVAEFEEPAPMKVLMTPDGQAIDLRQDPAVDAADFTQEHVGLDHIGFVCRSREELDAWQRKLQDEGVMESGVIESPFGWHVNFRDPDDIPLEFFLPRGRSRDLNAARPAGGVSRLRGSARRATADAAWNM